MSPASSRAKPTQSPNRTTQKGMGVSERGRARASKAPKSGTPPKSGSGKRSGTTSGTGSAGPSRRGGKSGAGKGGNKKRSKRAGSTAWPSSKRAWAVFLAKWSAITGLVLCALGAVTLAAMFWVYGSDPKLPRIESLSDYQPAQVNRVVTGDGQLIGEIFQQRRSMVAFEDLPEHLVQAFVSAEDKGFWKHEGIDYMGMMRAAIVNLRSGEKKQGASTITQQVVKNLLLSRARTFRRKFQEILLARRLEKALSKEEILMLYANEIFFGHGRYGVQEAARYYFGKDVKDIDVGEAALLAGLPKGPNLYSPKRKKNYERAKNRQVYVLQEMASNGYLSAEEAQKWIDAPIAVVADANPSLGAAPEFVEVAKAELVSRVGEDALEASGATVVTTVDLEVQELAREALRRNLREYDKRKGYGQALKTLKGDKIDLELVRLAKRLPEKGPRRSGVYRAIVLEVFDADNQALVDLGNYKAALLLGGAGDERFNPDGAKASARFKRGDVIRVVLAEKAPARAADEDDEEAADEESDEQALRSKHAANQVRLAPGPEGAVVVMDPKTRKLIALIGGYDLHLAGFNRATMAKRQAGSTFKPFVYAAAIDSGEFNAASIVNDAPEVYDLWKPENYKKGTFLGPVRLRLALEKSINTVAIRVAHDIGPERVRDLAHALGVRSELPSTLSLALGSGEVTPLELTNAFASFAAGGAYGPVWSVKSVGDEQIESAPPRSVLRPEVAYVVLDMMRTVMTQGTGAKAAKLGLDLAGKTGTSNNARDAWFVGMDANLVVGVWVGFDDFKRELGSHEGGSKTALPVFIDIMKELGKRSTRFDMPPGVVQMKIDEATGLLAAEASLAPAYQEVFLEGTGPTEFAPMAGEVGADDAILDQYGDYGDYESPPPPEATP